MMYVCENLERTISEAIIPGIYNTTMMAIVSINVTCNVEKDMSNSSRITFVYAPVFFLSRIYSLK
jgi:hypothetical protein